VSAFGRGLKTAVSVLFFLYPLLVFWVSRHWSVAGVSLLVGAVILIRLLVWPPGRSSEFGGAVETVLWVALANHLLNLYFQSPVLVKLYPFLMSAAMAMVFLRSLRRGRTPIIETFARRFEPRLGPERLDYIRRLTIVWSVWLVINTGLTFALAVAVPMAVWALYTNAVFYLICGGLVAGDLVARRWRLVPRERAADALTLSEATLARSVARRGDLEVSAATYAAELAAVTEHLRAQPARLALCLDDTYEFGLALFASLGLGKSVVMLPNNKASTREAFAQHFDAVVDHLPLANPPSAAAAFEVRISPDARLTFFTSGSSGQPKQIVKRFAHLVREARSLERHFGDGERLPIYATVSHQHIYGFLFKLLWPVVSGRSFGAQTIEYPEELVGISSRGAFFLVSTPAFLKRCYVPDFRTETCRRVFSSGGYLESSAADLAHSVLGIYPTEIYGSTESGGIAYREASATDGRAPWRPFAGIALSSSDEGQLKVCSPYFDEAILTMGDRVEFLPDASFRLLGRVDDVVKIEEKRVSLAELGDWAQRAGLTREVVMIALSQGGRQQTACLAVLNEVGLRLMDEGGHVELCSRLRARLIERFDAVVIPRKFRFLESLPYNEQSKLARADLARYFDEA